MVIRCESCGHSSEFAQPYAYHAGFADQGFLYDDAGTLTLVWSSFDPAFEAIVGRLHPWTLTPPVQAALEARLKSAPTGGRRRFSNPARCLNCRQEISGPMTRTVYYILYAGSLVLDDWQAGQGLAQVLCDPQGHTSG